VRRQIDQNILEMALVGYAARREEILQKIAEIERQLGRGKGSAASSDGSVETGPSQGKRRVSAAARARMAEGQRKRWAATKTSKPVAAEKPKRRLSAAGRAAIVAATKKRWALKRAEAAKQQ